MVRGLQAIGTDAVHVAFSDHERTENRGGWMLPLPLGERQFEWPGHPTVHHC